MTPPGEAQRPAFIIARRNLPGLCLTPLADFMFLREVARAETRASN